MLKLVLYKSVNNKYKFYYPRSRSRITDENEISIIPENMIEGDLETLDQGSNIILGDACI